MRARLAAFCRDWFDYAFTAIVGAGFLILLGSGAYVFIREAQVICQ